jgi:hypothetical protein
VRGSLPPRVSDMLAVRIGQLTAEVFHLLDLQPCWLLRCCHSYPHRTGRAGFRHPVPHGRASLAAVYDPVRDSSGKKGT